MAKGNTKAKKPSKIKSLTAITDPGERKKLKTALSTLTHHFQAIDDQKEAIKETVDDISSSTGLDKKVLRKLAQTMYKRNYASLQEENRHFESLYETVIEGRLLANKDPLDEKGDVEDVEEAEEGE